PDGSKIGSPWFKSARSAQRSSVRMAPFTSVARSGKIMSKVILSTPARQCKLLLTALPHRLQDYNACRSAVRSIGTLHERIQRQGRHRNGWRCRNWFGNRTVVCSEGSKRAHNRAAIECTGGGTRRATRTSKGFAAEA